jgi:uncharacterized membrane protein
MTIHPDDFLAILAMAAVTYATRISGFWLVNYMPKSGRALRALEALPPAVLTAVIAPAVLSGPAEAIGGLAAALAATRLPLVATVAIGVVTVAAFRWLLG